MPDTRHQQVEDLFHQVLEHGEASLDNVCVADPLLRDEVLALLRSYRAWSASVPAEQELPLPVFGAYQCDGVLGSGGMGTVYRAHRSDGQYSQQVAIKVLRSALHSEFLRRMFFSERQILARLNHPAIARLLDGGVTPSGEPYLVMELIEGVPIDAYCKSRQLSTEARLTLFDQVLDAVDHAHRNLVVHRDLKPSNILVTKEGRAKLLDFGTSKLTEGDDSTTLIRALTPRYASPEQLRGEPSGIASDVYSAGMILLDLLMLETAAQRDRRGSPLIEFEQWLSKDIACVLRMSLEEDPASRYSSIREFAADLKRFRSGQPVIARPQTLSYRATRFARRNRGSLAVTATALLVVLGLAGYALRTQQQALEQGRRAQRLNQFLMRLFQSASPSYEGTADMTVGDLADRALAQGSTMLAGQPSSQAELGLILAGHQIFHHGSRQALETIERAVAAARQAGDMGLLAEALADSGYFRSLVADCPDAMRLQEESSRIMAQYPRQLSRERRITALVDRAYTIAACSPDKTIGIRLIDEALRLANEIPLDSQQESTPPEIIRMAALNGDSLLKGCLAGEPARKEALELSGRWSMPYLRAQIFLQRGICELAEGRFADAASNLRSATELVDLALGKTSFFSRLCHSVTAWSQAVGGKRDAYPEAAAEARAALAPGCTEVLPLCRQLEAYAVETMVATGHSDEVLPQLNEMLKGPEAAVAGMCLFFHYSSHREFPKAARYRASAVAFLLNIPKSPWHDEIEAALARH